MTDNNLAMEQECEDSDCPVCEKNMDAYDKARKPLQDLLEATQEGLHEERLKIKELEEALEIKIDIINELMVENKDLAKAWKTLREFNDKTDNQEDEEIEELKKKLEKSEERVNEMQEFIDEVKHRFGEQDNLLKAEKALKEIETLKKLLIKEWGG